MSQVNPSTEIPDTEGASTQEVSNWTFLSNHSHVLVCLLKHPDYTVRQMSQMIGITERAILRVISDLEAAGVVQRTRAGRRNSYMLNLDVPLRHPVEAGHSARELLDFIATS
jgi:predicted HTH transcriptional regulator